MTAETTQALPDDPQALIAEIERTREQLGKTVDALAAKVDVRAQARRKVADLRERQIAGRSAGQLAGQAQVLARQRPTQAGAAAVVALVVTLLIVRRRHS